MMVQRLMAAALIWKINSSLVVIFMIQNPQEPAQMEIASLLASAQQMTCYAMTTGAMTGTLNGTLNGTRLLML